MRLITIDALAQLRAIEAHVMLEPSERLAIDAPEKSMRGEGRC